MAEIRRKFKFAKIYNSAEKTLEGLIAIKKN